MSTALALAAVTAVLRDLLLDGVIDNDAPGVGDVSVTALPPDRVQVNGTAAKSQLNLFLYQVTPNPGWRNEGLPARGAEGERRSNPPLALDLHYLVSAYGTADFHAEMLLGFAMQTLYETPVLTREALRTALKSEPSVDSGLPGFLGTLGKSGLAEQVEQIRITPASLSTDEMSKLWSACQASYRPSAVYQVSTVLIESSRPVREAFPVRERRLKVTAQQPPVIESVTPKVVTAGGSLAITGRNLAAEHLEVVIGGVPAAPGTVSATGGRVTVSALPMGLAAGVQTVRVAHGILFGTAADPHRGRESNLAAFVLAPRITASPKSVARGGALTLTVDPPVHAGQRVRVLLGEHAVEGIGPGAGAPPSATVMAKLPSPAESPGFPIGKLPLQVEVDGARSPLAPDPAPDGPYGLPAVVVA